MSKTMKPKEDYQSELVFLKPSIQESLYKQLKEETCFPQNTNFGNKATLIY